MKTLALVFGVLLCGVLVVGFNLPRTPKMKAADAAWERAIRRDFDLQRLHQFLLRTLAEQRKFADLDLASSPVGTSWKVDFDHRTLVSGGWWFRRTDKANGFEFRYQPEGVDRQGVDREVVLVCERTGRKTFRLIEIRWGVPILFLSSSKPN